MVPRAEGHARINDERDTVVRVMFPGWHDSEVIPDIDGFESLFPSLVPIGMLYHGMGEMQAHPRSEWSKKVSDDLKLSYDGADMRIA
jgi:hypothetical protein